MNPTTKRLVERCLSGDWCVQLRRINSPGSDSSAPGFGDTSIRVESPGTDNIASTSKNEYIPTSSPESSRTLKRNQSIKTSRSVENLRINHGSKGKNHAHDGEHYSTKQGNASVFDLQTLNTALPASLDAFMLDCPDA